MLKKITLTDFRNYSSLRTEFSEQFTVITGPNGAGKTNLLEAISFLSPGRGIRSAKTGEIRRSGTNAWSVVGEIGGYKISTGVEEGKERRTVKIDGESQKGSAILAEYAACIWLTPQMDGIFLEGSSERRRFFDRIIYNFDPEHAARVAVYENAMRERLRLLKDNINDGRWLTTLEQRMAEYGVAIAAARNEVMGYLVKALTEADTAFPTPTISIQGKYEQLVMENSALKTEEILQADLENSRFQDRQNGRSNCGVHKTNFHVIHTDKNIAANLASTGEQKALLLSIILALGRLVKQRKNKSPIMLLDEVVAHLDESRRKELFKELETLGNQTFLTGTETDLFTGLSSQSDYIRIENSNLVK